MFLFCFAADGPDQKRLELAISEAVLEDLFGDIDPRLESQFDKARAKRFSGTEPTFDVFMDVDKSKVKLHSVKLRLG
jgi:hypothetical protein